MNIAGILLAAGSSARFGSPKLLHQLPNGLSIGLQSALNLRSAIDHCIAVCHPSHSQLHTVFKNAGIKVVCNEQAQRGMGTSIACGVHAVSEFDAVVIALGDMPYLSSTTIKQVTQQLVLGKGIVVPRCRGRSGHPVGFGRQFFPELQQLNEDTGARSIVARHFGSVHYIYVQDEAVLRDIDAPV